MKRLLKLIRTTYCKIKYLKKCQINIYSYLNEKCMFEGKNRIGRNSLFYSSLMGLGSYIGNDNFFVKVKIGRYCSIGNDVKIVNLTHPINGVSTHPSFYSTNYGGFSYVDENKAVEVLKTQSGWSCEIGNDVWIGNHVLVRGGVKIGDGAVIAMGSVVTKDVPPYAIVGGCPAKVLKYRFDEETINCLLKSKWWEKSETWICEKSESFMNVQAFLEMCNNENM